MPYDKPTTKKFRDILIEKYENESNVQYLRNFLRNEKFQDIEHVLQSIKEIRLFLNGYGGEFFTGSYTPLKINNYGQLKDFNNKFFEEEIQKVENIIKDEIYEHYRWDDEKNEMVSKIFDELFSLFNPKEGIHVFTTNYDNAIETYCDITQKHKVIDGFKHNIRGRNYIWENFFNPPDHDAGIDVFLHKLHGSLDWKQLHNGKIVKTSEESKPADPRYKHNMVVYPTLSPKEEEASEPYKSIIQRFGNFMKNADICIVIGYSFRDHLNDVFIDFLNKGNTKLIIISPTAISDHKRNLLKQKTIKNKGSTKKIAAFMRMTMNSHITPDGKTSRIYCIPKPLDVKNVSELVKMVKEKFNENIQKNPQFVEYVKQSSKKSKVK